MAGRLGVGDPPFLCLEKVIFPESFLRLSIPPPGFLLGLFHMTKRVTDINITETRELPSPADLIGEISRSPEEEAFIEKTRGEIHRIIFGDDPRMLFIVGPCSIHDMEAGRDYARRLAKLANQVSDRLLLVMRVYFEKPRTTVGWKGMIMDPDLDNSCDIFKGLRMARSFLSEVLSSGLPTATELLDPITPQYIADLVSWSAIGARTTESQTHRQMASGLSMPLGFKNGTDGNLRTAINAIKAASQPQTFLGINSDGKASSLTTNGNPNCHLVLRGGTKGPNYSAQHVAEARKTLTQAGLVPAVMVDCSHDNSNKQAENQPLVLDDLLGQVASGDPTIIGCMLESNIHGNKQAFPQPKDQLDYGVSITDACLDWATTEAVIAKAYESMKIRFS